MSKATTQGKARDLPDLRALVKGVQRLLDETLKRRPPTPLFLLNLQNPHLILSSPLPITVHHDGVQVIVSSMDLDMFGYGETEPEAIYDFCRTVVELYRSLKEEEQQLGPHTQQIWNFMRRIIKEE